MRTLADIAGTMEHGPDALLRKYQELVRKHEQLVEKLSAQTLERSAVFRLAWWGMQTSASALALMSDQRVMVANMRWNQLQTAGRNVWVERDAQGGRAPARSLRRIAGALAQALAAAPNQAFSVHRLERIDGSEMLELRLDKLSRNPPMMLLMARDVTRELQAEAELARAREALGAGERFIGLGRLVTGVVHDLSSSLAAMRLRLQLLESDPELVLRHGRDLQAFEQIVSDAMARVRRLHDFARQRPEGPLEPVNLTRVIAEAIELARTEVEGRRADGRIQIRANLPELPQVKADAAELRYVLINLLMNARDAMPAGGFIDIRAEVGKRAVCVRVEDEGTGIPDGLQERIFEPLFTTKGRHGSGLGLAMAREAMTRCRGKITAANRKPRGAVFALTFPVENIEEGVTASAGARASSRRPRGRGRRAAG